jgi:hypothetical protein
VGLVALAGGQAASATPAASAARDRNALDFRMVTLSF